MLVNMNDVLLPAKEQGYAVGFFNAVNVEMARAIIETAEELNRPVMIGTAEILLPTMELERVAEYLIPMARKASALCQSGWASTATRKPSASSTRPITAAPKLG